MTAAFSTPLSTVDVQVPQALAALPFAGRTVAQHWQWLIVEAGLQVGTGSEALALDGALLGVTAETLRRIAHAEPYSADTLWDARESRKYDAGTLPVAEAYFVKQRVLALAAAGVRIVDPDRVWVDTTVTVEPGATLHACILRGKTTVAAGATVDVGAVLTDCVVEAGAHIKPYSVCESAHIGEACAVGPMAHLRAGTVLMRDVKVGNFVEVKQSTLHPGVRASHLTYLGDAEVFDGANIGAGTITCNYDGFGKHRTEIGANAFVGSNTALVAPVRVGAGAIVGAGATVTRNVPDEALMVERAEERIYEGKAPRLRERNRARAAQKKSD